MFSGETEKMINQSYADLSVKCKKLLIKNKFYHGVFKHIPKVTAASKHIIIIYGYSALSNYKLLVRCKS